MFPFTGTTWLAGLRCYIVFIAVANLLWEVAHVPLYTIWQTGNVREIAFAAIHCTGGDILIASTALLGALLLLGNPRWPEEQYLAVAASAWIIGLGYSAFSEWLNTTVRHNWAYTDLMPTLPAIDVGLYRHPCRRVLAGSSASRNVGTTQRGAVMKSRKLMRGECVHWAQSSRASKLGRFCDA